MKREIALFTGTGNTLFVANQIANEDEIFFIEKYIDGTKTIDEDTESLGIMFPTHVGTIPDEVEIFIKEVLGKRDNSNLGYVFSICTYGGIKGSANSRVEKLLKEAGIALSYSNAVRMPDAYLPIDKKPLSEMETLAFINKKLNKLDKIKNDIEIERVRLTPFSEKIGAKIHKWAKGQKDRYTKTNNGLKLTDRCVGCATCYRICPVDNIVMKDGKPKFRNHCIECYACFHRCPNFAYEYKGVKSQYKGLEDTSKLFRR